MKKRTFALVLSAVLCIGLIPNAYAGTTLNMEGGSPKLEYEDPNPLPPPPGSVEDEPIGEGPVEIPVNNPFDDVRPDDFFYDAVLWAAEQGIIGGSGSFGPNEVCSRAETVYLLWRAAGSPQPDDSASPFTDVRPGDYFYDAVLWAVEQGIASGTSGAGFSPNATVNRAQAVTFLFRAVKAQDTGGGSAFADVPANAYYAGPVRWAVSQGIASGTSADTFGPDLNCTRAHIVTFLYRAQGQ